MDHVISKITVVADNPNYVIVEGVIFIDFEAVGYFSDSAETFSDESDTFFDYHNICYCFSELRKSKHIVFIE